MKKILLLCSISLLAFSCSKQERNEARAIIIEDLSTTTSSLLASPALLNCAKPELMKEKFASILKDAPILKDEALDKAIKQKRNKSAITKYICEQGITYTIPLLVGSAIPAEWECQNTVIDELAKKAAEEVCKNL